MSRAVLGLLVATLAAAPFGSTARAAPFFETTWESAAGTTTEAVTDGGLWDRHETNTPSMIEVAPATGPSLPAELEGLNMATVWLEGETGWAMLVEDDVGTDTVSDFYWRMYLRVNGDLTGYANMHGFQDFEMEGPLSTNAYIGIGYIRDNGTWTPYLASGMEQTEMEAQGFMVLDEFTPELMLATDRWYRLEGHIAYESRDGDEARTYVDIRIFDPEVSDERPVLTGGQFRASNCFGECYGTTLQSHYDAGERFILRSTSSTFTVGNNGPATAVGSAPMYDITGFALAHDGWIGPVGAAPGGEDTGGEDTGGDESGGGEAGDSESGADESEGGDGPSATSDPVSTDDDGGNGADGNPPGDTGAGGTEGGAMQDEQDGDGGCSCRAPARDGAPRDLVFGGALLLVMVVRRRADTRRVTGPAPRA